MKKWYQRSIGFKCGPPVDEFVDKVALETIETDVMLFNGNFRRIHRLVIRDIGLGV